MKNLFLYTLLVFLLSGSQVPTDKPKRLAKVPYTKSTVMLNGQIEKGEWDKAMRVRVSDSLELLLQQDAENIYVCLSNMHHQSTLMMVDFYVQAPDKALLNLHASAKLGERKLTAQDYGDWQWWNNQQWYANIARIDDFENRKFLFDEAKEFQLRKSRFNHPELKLMFDMSYPPQRSTTYPAKASTTNPENWLEVRLR